MRPMSLPSSRRTATLLAAPALVVTALVGTSAPASAATDPAPVGAGAAWLESQLNDGVIHYDDGTYSFDDLALSADVGFALEAVGGHDDTVAQIVAAVAPRAHDEWYTSTYDGVTTLYAGSLAKAAAFAQATGADPTAFGGQDLITTLEGTVAGPGPTAGRFQDENNDYGDTNTFGQAYAAEALDAAGSTSAASVTAFLLEQQCSGGWFRLNFADRGAAAQSCDGGPAADSEPDTDATAIALTALVSMHDDALVPAIQRAEQWLLDTQHANGSWGGGPTTEVANANSTGLAGAVLGQLGDTQAAQDAAALVRAHQLARVGACAPYRAADLGAVAYDDATRSALTSGVDADATTQDQVRRATAQALPVLAFAQPAGETHALASPEYVKGGTRVGVGVIGAAPGEMLCAKRLPGDAGNHGWANRNGEGHLRVHVPARTATNRIRVWNGAGVVDTVHVNALGPAQLTVSLQSKRVAGGHDQTVTLRGLEPGEMAEIDIRWPRNGSGASGQGVGGQANRNGVFHATFRVPHAPGTAAVKGFGQFKNRKDTASFTVTR